jgi:PPOX class probable F420-dependent enzyme
VELPENVVALLSRPSPCFIATVMADGSPQLTQTWVDTDGTNVLVNTVQGFVKLRNIQRDPRVALNVADPDAFYRYVAIRGEVVDITTDGATEHIEKLAQRYTGRPYAWYGGKDQVRTLLTIKPTHLTSTGF